MSAGAQPPVGALALDDGQGNQYGWAVDYGGCGAGSRASRVRAGLLGGSDVRAVRGVRGGPGLGRHGGGLAESYGSAAEARQAALPTGPGRLERTGRLPSVHRAGVASPGVGRLPRAYRQRSGLSVTRREHPGGLQRAEHAVGEAPGSADTAR